MKRRHRAARPVFLNAVQRAIESAAKLSPDNRAALLAIVQQAVDGIRKGVEPWAAWTTLADALNVAEQLAEIGICSDEDSKHRIAGGQGALVLLFNRHADAGTWTARADELKALDEAVWLHGVQLEHCSLGEWQRAMRQVADRTKQALAGNAPKGTRIIDGRISAERAAA